MRHLISGLVAAVAVMAAAPAMACGYSSCSPCGYVSPCAQTYVAPVATYGYGGCNTGCGWATERLAQPTQQYYYVNQGPTYSGPGNWAPQPAYQEEGVSYGYRSHYGYRGHYGYGGYRAYRPHVGYPRMMGYGYAPRHAYAPYHYGRPLRRFY
jgi:hypothetical protein